ncbi:helix-turn-helix transcriptional regulator [Nocardioides daeguensis]|uniref:AAA family ATPase n=1 Tax=Nocardioides daeguensis TaxID=908359 RepID=A0ABP6V7V5_9ACTN|nr:LuxR family transcriptional regulator [Nocardioides daeguensis]MBV6726438.1 AAA family ATPase [Nocardioides daeguensis]MCR1772281.1 AAA family ATPase [Nocardioides daeguensis]
MPSGRLVEREASRAQAGAALDRLRAGNGGALCLLGPAGVGKTSLLDSVLSEAGDLRVLRAAAGELEAHAPYGVVRHLLGRVLTSLAPVALDGLDGIAHGAASAAVDLVLHRGEPVGDASVMLNSLYWLLDGLAADGPLVLAVDDAHWADEASLVFCQHLLSRADELPVLLVVAARDISPERRSPALAALVAGSTRLDLEPLSAAGVRSCLADLGHAGISDELAAACADVTGGNPFLVTALAELIGTTDVRSLVPRTVVDTVVQRLTALGTAEQALARAVAVLETAPLRIAADLADLTPERAGIAADRLRDAGLLATERQLGFRHALLRSAVAAATGAATRDDLHRRAARVLADEPDGVHPAAGHLLEAEGIADPWAAALLRTAARAAIADGAPQAAVDLLRRAVAEPPPASELPGLLVELGTAELHAGDPASVTTLERAGRGVTDPVLRAHCALGLATAYHVGGFYERSVPVLEGALAHLGPEHGDLTLVVEAALVAAEISVPGRFESARARLAAHGELVGTTPGERLLLIHQASVANATLAPIAKAGELARRAIGDGATPEQLASPFAWSLARIHLACSGEYDAAAELCAQGLELAAREGSVPLYAAASVTRGWAHLWAGRLDDSGTDFAEALRHAEVVPGGQLVRLMAAAGLAEALLAQGRLSEAVAALAQVPEEVAVDRNHATGIHLLRARGQVRAAIGDHEGALSSLRMCADRLAELDMDSPTWCGWRAVAIESLWALGRVDEARELTATELAVAEQKAAPSMLGQALRIAGEVAATDGIALLERSVEVLTGSQARLQEARSRVALGAALRRTGQRAEGREQLRIGRELAHRLGAAVLTERATTELALAGGRAGRIEVSGVAALTSAERRVVELAASGLRNREIAQRLFLSTKTVEVHLSRAYRKLGVGRDGLAALLAAAPDS